MSDKTRNQSAKYKRKKGNITLSIKLNYKLYTLYIIHIIHYTHYTHYTFLFVIILLYFSYEVVKVYLVILIILVFRLFVCHIEVNSILFLVPLADHVLFNIIDNTRIL